MTMTSLVLPLLDPVQATLNKLPIAGFESSQVRALWVTSPSKRIDLIRAMKQALDMIFQRAYNLIISVDREE